VRLAREPGQPHDLIGGGAVLADAPEVAFVEAGQHGDGDHQRPRRSTSRRVGGRGHHRAAACGMDVEHERLQRQRRANGRGHGVGDVVKLEIQEQGRRGRRVHDGANALGALGREEFETELDAAADRREGSGERRCARDIGRVESGEQTLRGRVLAGRKGHGNSRDGRARPAARV
jgi:hypothetical protein